MRTDSDRSLSAEADPNPDSQDSRASLDYQDDGERTFEGSILFSRTDVEECSILIFDHPFGYDGVKEFSGKRISLEEFQEKYPKAEFEITTEGYHGYDTMFQGWL